MLRDYLMEYIFFPHSLSRFPFFSRLDRKKWNFPYGRLFFIRSLFYWFSLVGVCECESFSRHDGIWCCASIMNLLFIFTPAQQIFSIHHIFTTQKSTLHFASAACCMKSMKSGLFRYKDSRGMEQSIWWKFENRFYWCKLKLL